MSFPPTLSELAAILLREIAAAVSIALLEPPAQTAAWGGWRNDRPTHVPPDG